MLNEEEIFEGLSLAPHSSTPSSEASCDIQRLLTPPPQDNTPSVDVSSFLIASNLVLLKVDDEQSSSSQIMKALKKEIKELKQESQIQKNAIAALTQALQTSLKNTNHLYENLTETREKFNALSHHVQKIETACKSNYGILHPEQEKPKATSKKRAEHGKKNQTLWAPNKTQKLAKESDVSSVRRSPV